MGADPTADRAAAARARVEAALARVGRRLRLRAALSVLLPGMLVSLTALALLVAVGSGAALRAGWGVAGTAAALLSLVAASVWRASGRGGPAEAALWLDAREGAGEARFAAYAETQSPRGTALRPFAPALAARCARALGAPAAAPARAVPFVRGARLLPLVAAAALGWVVALAVVAGRTGGGEQEALARGRAADQLRRAAGAALPGELGRELERLADGLDQGRLERDALLRARAETAAEAARVDSARERMLDALRRALAGGGAELEALLEALVTDGEAAARAAVAASATPGAAAAGEQLALQGDPALEALGRALRDAEAERARAAARALVERLDQLAMARLEAAGAVARVEAALRDVDLNVSTGAASASVATGAAPGRVPATGGVTDDPPAAPAAAPDAPAGAAPAEVARAGAAGLPPGLAAAVERFQQLIEERR